MGRKWNSTSPSSWLKQISNYCKKTLSHSTILLSLTVSAPVPEDIPLSYSSIQFNGSLLKENIFRQPESPEVEAAWDSLGVNCRALIIPSSLAQESSLARDQVKINKKYGSGYPANVEGLHHLHCLNLQRQSLWYNYDYYHKLGEGAFKNEDYIVKFYVSHCLEHTIPSSGKTCLRQASAAKIVRQAHST
jgi:hypothetical protein